MNNFTFYHNGKTYTRVNKRRAQTLILRGKTIICAPSNLRPFGMWSVGAVVNKETLNAQYNYKEVKLDKNILHYFAIALNFIIVHPKPANILIFM